MTNPNQTALEAAMNAQPFNSELTVRTMLEQGGAGYATLEAAVRAYLDALPAAPLPEEVERAAEAAVDALFEDLRDRRFLKWLFSEMPTVVAHFDDGSPLTSLDLDVQDEIKAAWKSILEAALAQPASGEGWTVPAGCLNVGHQVEKTKGYPFPGEVRSVFKTRAGVVRYVIEATGEAYRGMLHIFSADQIAAAPTSPREAEGEQP